MRKPEKEERRRLARVASREVSRSIEAAQTLFSLGKTREAVRQVEKVTAYYKNKLGGVGGWAEDARRAESFLRRAGRKIPAADKEDGDQMLFLDIKQVEKAISLGAPRKLITLGDQQQLFETFASNVIVRKDYLPRTRPPQSSRIPGAPKEAAEIQEYRGDQAQEALQLLEEISKHRGRTVNLSLGSNRKISPADITAVGGTINRFANGYYVVLDRAQWDVLNEMRPPDASEPPPLQLSDFFVGNDAVMSNTERVRLSRTVEKDNVFVVRDKEVRLNPNQFLLVANDKGNSILGAGRAVDWGEVRAAEEITEPGFTLDIPSVGRVHLFEKLLLREGEKPEILIEYEGKKGGWL